MVSVVRLFVDRMEAGMEIRIRVVEFEGQRMFECEGVKFNSRIGPFSAQEQACAVLFRRDGNEFDSGRVGPHKLWQDSDREDMLFVGFAREELTGGRDYISGFEAEQLELGDEIVFTLDADFDFLGGLFLHYLSQGWNPIRWEMKELFPYPDNWRTDRAAARAVFERKIAFVREALQAGRITFLDFNYPVPRPEKKETQFEIQVRERDGKKYFFFAGIYFNTLPRIKAFWDADNNFGGCRVNVYRGRRRQIMSRISVHTVGTHAATLMFSSWDHFGTDFLNGHPYAMNLLADNFGVGYRLVVESPMAFDLVEGLAEYLGSGKHPDVARLEAVNPDYAEQEKEFGDADFWFGLDIAWDFGWRVRDKKVELVKAGQITVLEFDRRE